MNLKKKSQSLLKKRLICFLFCLCFESQAEQSSESSKKSMYRYVLENYFSKRGSSYQGSRYFFLAVGMDVYRVKKNKKLKNFSALELSYTQNIKEIFHFGDIQLRVSALSSQLEKKQRFSLELTPLLTVPEISVQFPFYLSMGLGAGVYPIFLIRQQSPLSLHASFLAGMRFLNLYHNLGLAAELNLKAHYPLEFSEFYLQTGGALQMIFRF